MSSLAHNTALWLILANVAVIAGSLLWTVRNWRFDRLALRGFDLPFEPAGPFRQSEAELRPLFGFERDPGCQLFFILHLLAAIGGVASLALTLWCAFAILDGVGMTATTVAALAGLFAALMSVPMWLGRRLMHGVVGGLTIMFVLALWPPAVCLLLVIIVVQHDLIRRRAVADEREFVRRQEHARRRQTGAARP